ncbi:MAG TPA: hypothetical protein VG944_10160 [Fimbriimonas sp.]|nr:hypothetical protein [Fimbriimonas sp.]
MESDLKGQPAEAGRTALSRRQILVGAVASAIVAGAPSALASAKKVSRKAPVAGREAWDLGFRRYMMAAATLLDGRILVTGGYDRPASNKSRLRPLASCFIMSPDGGTCVPVEPMILPRARHAAATMPDGRVVVFGGMSEAPTASIEIFDPFTGHWEVAEPMLQARYDHVAVVSGAYVHVFGGSGMGILSSVESFMVTSSRGASPQP